MGGGLMQLVAYGAQDIYLTGNPQITFFKVVYRRHTNFSMESIAQTFNGTADFGKDVSATISRNGDLVYRMYLEHNADFKASTGADTHQIGVCADYGSYLMKEVELEIGGQKIDKHYGHWNSVYSQLTQSTKTGSKNSLYNLMSGNGQSVETADSTKDVVLPNGFQLVEGANGGSVEATAKGKFWIPLHFWFCRNPGLALPLIALQYHEVKVKITFEDLNKLIIQDTDDGSFGDAVSSAVTDTNKGTDNTFELWCDYIYLDTDERRRFAQVSHEYLIEQLQFENKSAASNMELNFNHPVKELIWAGVRKDTLSAGDDGDGSVANIFFRDVLQTNDDNNFQLKLNGHDRFAARNYKYFTRTQIWEHHSGYGCTETGDTIAVYSFALKPEEHQPSGSCNFSRIDNAHLIRSGTGSDNKALNVYAVNYNVLRIMSGMGGLAYSN